jgi:RNA polymerase sigma-70 factor (ECF subfamily)
MRALAFLAMANPAGGTDAGTNAGPDASARAIAAARTGGLAAFETLMRQHERLVLVTALRLLGNIEDAKDASQEVFLRLYRNLGKVGASGNFPAWLYRVTVNVCYDMGRKRASSVPMEDVPNLAAPGADPQESAAGTERQRVLHMSLRVLSAKERAALVLRDLEGLSTGEVARALGSSEATVRSQISQARVKVKDFVERYFRRRV